MRPASPPDAKSLSGRDRANHSYLRARIDARGVRLVQITIPAGKREAVLGALDDEAVDYVVSDESSQRDYAAIAYVPLPTNAVEPVLEAVREAGLGEEAYTVILEANTVVSRRFDELEERYAEDDETEERIARQELTAAAADLAPSTSTFVGMTVVSALIATAGLLLDSPAVVVGSMVIAPLIGPAMAASVGTVVDDQELFRRGVRLQVTGLLLAIATAAAFATLVRYANLIPPIPDVFTVPEIQERVAPDVLSLVVALGAGAAGVLSLTSGVSAALVGVMIAVALLPPAATVGIGIAWADPLTTLGSSVLLLVNVISINLAAILVLWYTGYRPKHWFRENEAKSATITRVTVLAVAIVVLSAFLGGVTYDSYRQATTEEQLREEVGSLVAATDGAVDFDVRLLEVDVAYTNTALFREPNRVTVTVGVTPGEELSGLGSDAETIAREVTGRDVEVVVRYMAMETG
jgi:uncharacterized hydrophobic protein (TIGR00341 family)